MRTHKAGFTLLELLVAVIIIGVLAVAVIVNLSKSQVRARDANRRSDIDAYGTSLEQWRTLSPTKSYFIQIVGSGLAACNASNPINTTVQQGGSTSTPGYGYMTGSGGSCVGDNGGGAGRITRSGITGVGYSYPVSSITDALRLAGVLNSANGDPSEQGQPYSDDKPLADFILTTCDTNGYAAATPANALTYAIYANLENPETNPTDEAANASHLCGGTATGKRWSTVDGSSNSNSMYNYGQGSSRF